MHYPLALGRGGRGRGGVYGEVAGGEVVFMERGQGERWKPYRGVGVSWYKNNDGNYSLRVVPILWFQPRLTLSQITVIVAGCFR
jgi:hypothetical protein